MMKLRRICCSGNDTMIQVFLRLFTSELQVELLEVHYTKEEDVFQPILSFSQNSSLALKIDPNCFLYTEPRDQVLVQTDSKLSPKSRLLTYSNR